MSAILAIDVTDELVHVGLLGLDGTIFAAGQRTFATTAHAIHQVNRDQEWLGALIACCQEVRAAYPTTQILAVGMAGHAGVLVTKERFSTRTLTVRQHLSSLIDVELGTPLVLAPSGTSAILDALFGRTVGAGVINLGTTPWIAALAEGAPFPDVPPPPGVESSPAFPGFDVHSAHLISQVQALNWARSTWLPNMSRQEADEYLVQQGGTTSTSGLTLTPISSQTYSVSGLNDRTKPWQFYLAAYEYLAYSLTQFAQLIGLTVDVLPLLGIRITHPVWPQLIADTFNQPVVAVHSTHLGLHAVLRAITLELGWATTAPIPQEGIVISPGPRAKDYVLLQKTHEAISVQLAPIRWAIS